jgi:hypothetical protein
LQDPSRLGDYLRNNPFLPDINNEKQEKNKQVCGLLSASSHLYSPTLRSFGITHLAVFMFRVFSCE